MQKNNKGRMSKKLLMKRLKIKSEHIIFSRTFLYLNYIAKTDRQLISNDKKLLEAYHSCLKGLIDLHIFFLKREEENIQMQIIEQVSDVYTRYVADEINYGNMQKEVNRIFKKFRLTSKLKNIKFLYIRKDKIKNLFGPKRSATLMVAKLFGISRSQIEYNCRKARVNANRKYIFGFRDSYILTSHPFLFQTLKGLFNLKSKSYLRLTMSKIYNYHIKEMDKEYKGNNPMVMYELDKAMRNYARGNKVSPLVYL